MHAHTRAVVGLLVFVAFVDNFAMLPTVAPYAEQLGAGLTGVGVAVAAYSATNLVFNIVGGRLLDRIGRRRLTVASLCVVGAAMLSYPLVSTLGGLIGVRLLHGIGGGILVPAVFTVVGDVAPSTGRGRAMGRVGAVIGAAAVVAPAVAGGVRQAAGFTAVFLLVAAVMGLGAFAAARWLPETAPAQPTRRSPTPVAALLRRPRLLAAGLTAFVFTGVVGSLAAFLPVHVEGLGLPAGVTGAMFTLFAVVAVAMMLSRLAGVVDLRGMVAPATAGLALYAGALGTLSVGPPFGLTAVAVAVFGLGYGLVFPAMSAEVSAAAAPEERGAAYGVFLAWFSAGFVVVPPLGGLVGDTTALGPSVVAAACALIGSVLLLSVRSRLAAERLGRPDH